MCESSEKIVAMTDESDGSDKNLYQECIVTFALQFIYNFWNRLKLIWKVCE